MKQFRIWFDERAYGGIDPDGEEPANYGGSGWHQHNYGARDVLLIGGDQPYRIGGEVNLLSHLQRITERLRDGTITAKRIVIEIEAPPHE